MNTHERAQYEAIIKDFEESYRKTNSLAGHPDNDVTRAGFYNSCLRLVRDGAPMKSPMVQMELVNYYSKKLDGMYKKIIGDYFSGNSEFFGGCHPE